MRVGVSFRNQINTLVLHKGLLGTLRDNTFREDDFRP
jgi:hypothetical protein